MVKQPYARAKSFDRRIEHLSRPTFRLGRSGSTPSSSSQLALQHVLGPRDQRLAVGAVEALRDERAAGSRVLDVELLVEVEVGGRLLGVDAVALAQAGRPSWPRSRAARPRSRRCRRASRAASRPSPRSRAQASVSGAGAASRSPPTAADEAVPQLDVRGLLDGVRLERRLGVGGARASRRRARRPRGGTGRCSTRAPRASACPPTSVCRTDGSGRSSARARRPALRRTPWSFATPSQRQQEADRRRDATLPPVRTPVGKIAAPMFPDGTGWLNVEPIQHGPAARPARADRVLRRLPRQLAAHAALRQGVGGEVPRPARDLRALARLPALARRRRRARSGRSGSGSSTPSSWTTRLAIWRLYGNEGWPGRYLWDKRQRLFEIHYGEGAYARDRGLDPGAARRRGRTSSTRCAPRTSRPRCSSCRRPTSRARTRARTRPARSGPCWRAPARSASTATTTTSRTPARTSSSSTASRPRACWSSTIGEGVTCHATTFTPGLAP